MEFLSLFRGTVILTWAQTKLMFRDFGAVFWSLLFPVLMVVIIGHFFGNDPRPEFGGKGFIDIFIPGVTAIAISSTSFYQVGVALVFLRERQALRRLRVSPLSASSIVVAQIIPGYIMILLTTVVVWLTALFIYEFEFQGKILVFFASLSFGALGFLAIAFVMASLIRSSGTAYNLSTGLNMIMMVFSGSIIPLAVMPERFQQIGKFVPLTYVVNILRAAFAGEPLREVTSSILVVLGFLIGGVLISSLTFKWE